MNIRPLLLALPVAFCMASAQTSTPAQAQTGFTFKRTAKVGDAITYKLTVKATISTFDATLTSTAIDKVSKFDDAAGYTLDETWSDSKVDLGGGQQVDGPALAFSLSYSPKNELKEVASSSTEVDDTYKTWFYLYDVLHSLRAPEKPVKVGDSWTAKLAPTPANGNVAADLTYQVDGEETIGTIPCARVKLAVKVTSGGEETSDMTIWVSKADNSIVKITGTILKLTFPQIPTPVDAKYTLERQG